VVRLSLFNRGWLGGLCSSYFARLIGGGESLAFLDISEGYIGEFTVFSEYFPQG
jgi:hypothetical protein